VTPVDVYGTAATALAGLLVRLWVEVLHPSLPSLAAAPFVILGYWLLGRGDRRGFLSLLVSQGGLVVLGIIHREWALPAVIVPPVAFAAIRGYRRAGRPNPLVQRLERELAEARGRIAELEGRPAA
jgi:hypothetical protein